MRVGGGEMGSRRRGAGGKSAAVMVIRRKAGEEAERGGCSASSTSSGRGSSRGDSPLPSYMRGGGRARTDLEPDGGQLTSSSSYASAVSTEPREEEDDRASEGEKDERWVPHGRIQQAANNGVPRSNSGECQDRRHGMKDRAQRPVSLDFGCPGVARSSTQSPGLPANGVGVMNKGLGVPSHYGSDVLSSPGTPNYHRRRGTAVAGYQQGCNSERATPPADRHRRHPGSSMVLPYNNGGKTLPSKWEDAERWIFSTPNPSNAPGRSLPQLWRPKSKSGPIGPPNRFGGPCSSVSSSLMLVDNGGVGNVTVNSPFLAGVLLPEHICGSSIQNGKDLSTVSVEDSRNGQGCRYAQSSERHPATRSTWTSMQFESYQSLPTSCESIQDVESETTKDSTASSFPVRKDVATQTSPDISRSSSPSNRPSVSRSLSVQQVKELESCLSKLEIRDVQIDDRVTLTRWSKKQVTRGSDKNSTNIIEWKKRTVESKSSAWEVTETAKSVSKIEGEEANMSAWENVQKAQAEAAIQKLVIKLEKKRPYSLERIFNTLRSGHRKTQVLRSTATANHDQHIARSIRRPSNLSKNGQTSSLSGCFTCHAF